MVLMIRLTDSWIDERMDNEIDSLYIIMNG